jgi:hypothetical protein
MFEEDATFDESIEVTDDTSSSRGIVKKWIYLQSLTDRARGFAVQPFTFTYKLVAPETSNLTNPIACSPSCQP